jgi:DNA-directed RNA polymerase III subunit RPC6
MPPVRKKRDAVKIEGPSKKARTTVKAEPQPVASTSSSSSGNGELKKRFLEVLAAKKKKTTGAGGGAAAVSNSELKETFGTEYTALAIIMNELIKETRITFSRNNISGELYYQLVDADVAAQLQGLDGDAITVYQVIEKAGNMGIWTRDIKNQTKIQPTAMTRILKSLETRRLVKPIKSVMAKTKKLYILFNLEPSKELTGGIWYSDMEYDHEFITELRLVLLQHIRKTPMTAAQLWEVIAQMKISKVSLEVGDVMQLLNTLEHDYLVEKDGATGIYQSMRSVTGTCEFKMWDVLEDDFAYRAIRYEDGVVLAPQEAHHQTE